MRGRIFASKDKMKMSSLLMSSFGNKILHLFFVLKYAALQNWDPVVVSDSNVDDVFDCTKIKHLGLHAPPFLFVEKTAFVHNEIWKVVRDSREQFIGELGFLKTAVVGRSDFSVEGNFNHCDLMPSLKEVERFIRVRPDVIEAVLKKYPRIKDHKSLAVHFRGRIFGGTFPGSSNPLS